MRKKLAGIANTFTATTALVVILLTGCASNNDEPSNATTNPSGATTTQTKTAVLHGAQQIPNITTSAAGYGSVVVNTSTRAITGGVTFTGMTATIAHIHTGAAGSSGGSVVGLTVDNTKHMASIPDGTVLTQQQYDDLVAGNLYFNVHSSANTSGEIRGQIGRLVVTSTMSGDQNVPPVTTSASGTAIFAIDSANRSLSGSAKFSGVTGTLSHLHNGAIGVNGGAAITLTVDNSVESASVPANTTLTETQYNDLRAGKLYLNVHSDANKGGEIRGQVGPVVMTALLDGAQNVPAVTTSAMGRAVFIINPTTRTLTGGVSYEGLNATMSHIHVGAVGENGSGIVTLAVDSNTNTATVPVSTMLTQNQYDDLIAGNYYVNVHSSSNPGGEIRGQLTLY